MKARHDWSPAARDQFFGPDPQGGDPLPRHAKAIAAYRAALTEAYQASVQALSSNETAQQFLGSVTAAAVVDAPPSAAPMRVVLMGRTMAGKSTLLAVLTGGSAERIGVGAQRTSTDVFAAPAVDLHDVEIVDTPGVGAKDGAEDAALAMAEVPGADLVLWVASNDSFQEETAHALRTVAFRGKPVVVALNCRAPLDDDLDREDFLASPDAVFDQHEGHFETIRAHLAAAGVRPVAEVMLHAEAARHARTDDNFSHELMGASRLATLLQVLEHDWREHRTVRRVLRETDGIRAQGQALSEAIADVELEVREIVQVGRGIREDQQRRTARLVEACEQRMKDDIIRIIGHRQGWHQTVTDFGPEVSERWEAEQNALVVELDEALNNHIESLLRAIQEVAAATEREWTAAVRPHLKLDEHVDFRGLWKRRAAGIAVGTGGALAAAGLGFLIGGPAGALVAGVGSLFITPIRKKVQSAFTSKAKLLEKNRDLLRAKIGEILVQLERQTLTAATGIIAGVHRQLADAFTRRAETESAALEVADKLASQRQVIKAATTTLDNATAACLLLIDGRPRLAASVERATRLPGVCVAVQVADQALAEAWLFPPSSPEIVTFGRAPAPALPGVRAISYVLGLTEEVPPAVRSHHDGTLVTTHAPVPGRVLEAWSAALSDHLDTQVKINRISNTRSSAR